MWTRKDNGSDVDSVQAIAYCSKLQLAGYTGWRLPTSEELQGIYDPSVSARKVFDGVTTEVHVKGNLDLTGHDWSSSQGDGLGKPYQTAWEFTFSDRPWDYLLPNPFLNFMHFGHNMRALCVRRPQTEAMSR